MKMKKAIAAVCIGLAIQMSPGLALAADSTSEGFSGTVVQTTNAASYTYVEVDTGKEKIWAAAPHFEVKPGDKVSSKASLVMPNYESKTLSRKFDKVHFAEFISVNGSTPLMSAAMGARTTGTNSAGQLPKGHPPVGGEKIELPKGHPPITGGSAKPGVDFRGLKKAEGGLTVAEIYNDPAKLKGKQVKVRGKVVKYNAMIMGKNWIHLRDGTGAEGKNDLLLTTSTPAKVGDTILATGAISINKDFGSGYKFPVMIEDAQVTVEQAGKK